MQQICSTANTDLHDAVLDRIGLVGDSTLVRACKGDRHARSEGVIYKEIGV
jgi:hypothetical protein